MEDFYDSLICVLGTPAVTGTSVVHIVSSVIAVFGSAALTVAGGLIKAVVGAVYSFYFNFLD